MRTRESFFRKSYSEKWRNFQLCCSDVGSLCVLVREELGHGRWNRPLPQGAGEKWKGGLATGGARVFIIYIPTSICRCVGIPVVSPRGISGRVRAGRGGRCGARGAVDCVH